MLKRFLQKRFLIAIILAVMLVAAGFATHMAVATDHEDTQTVTVNVMGADTIEVADTAFSINVLVGDTATGDGGTLLWTTGFNRRITVSATRSGDGNTTLKLLAINPTDSTPATEISDVTSGTNDLVTGITQNGSCTLLYTADAGSALAGETDVYAVLFTITSP